MSRGNHSRKAAIRKPDNTVEYSSFEGVMPDAEELGKLESVCPGAAQKWMNLAEKEITSRQSNEKQVIQVFMWSTYLGQILAFLSSIIIIGLSYLYLQAGHPTAGATIVVSSIASVIAAYLSTNKRKN